MPTPARAQRLARRYDQTALKRGKTISAAALGAVVTSLIPATAADAGVDRQIRALQRSSCPVKYEALHQRTYPADTQKRAMRAKFAVTDRKFRVNLRPPISWGENKLGSKSYKAKLHAMGWLDVLFFIYNASDRYSPRQKRDALALARDLVLDFIESNPLGGDRVANKAWLNKVTGDRVGYFSYLTRAAECERLLNREQRGELVGSLGVHGRHLERSSVYSPSNHGLSVDLGLGLLARYAPFLPGAARWDALSQKRFRLTLLRRLQTAEGVWEEHSPEYQLLVTKVLDVFVRATNPEDNLLHRLLARMRFAATAFVMPDGTLPQFGDTPRSPVKKTLQADAEASGLDALLRFIGSGRAEGTSLADSLPTALAALIGRNRGLVAFPRSGYAIVKQPSTQSFLAVASAFHNLSHKHADELSFELFDRGYRIVSDSGFYNKDQNRFWKHQRSAQAHSTLTVDRRNFRLRRNRAYGSGIQATGQGVTGWYGIQAQNPLVRRQGVTHERLFLYKPSQALIVVDRVQSPKKHLYERRFQLGPELGIRKSGPSVLLGARGFEGELYNAIGTSASDRRMVKGDNETLEGFTFPGFRQKDRRWTVNYRTRERDAVHVTTFSLDPANPVRAELPPGGDGSAVDLYSGASRTSRLTTTGASSGNLTVLETPGL